MTDWADEKARRLCWYHCGDENAICDCGELRAALREAEERRDREWASALWPCDPEGQAPLERMTPDDGAAWLRTQTLAVEAAAEERGTQRERWACHAAIDKLYARWKRERGYPLDFGRAATLAAISARGPMLAPEEEL